MWHASLYLEGGRSLTASKPIGLSLTQWSSCARMHQQNLSVAPMWFEGATRSASNGQCKSVNADVRMQLNRSPRWRNVNLQWPFQPTFIQNWFSWSSISDALYHKRSVSHSISLIGLDTGQFNRKWHIALTLSPSNQSHSPKSRMQQTINFSTACLLFYSFFLHFHCMW